MKFGKFFQKLRCLTVAGFVWLAPFASTSAAPDTPAAPPPVDELTTEALRAQVFGENETIADLWLQFHAITRFERWSEAAVCAQQILLESPEALLRKPLDEPVYWPARRIFADIFRDNEELAAAYRHQYDPIAESLLAAFRQTHRLETLERLLVEYPFAAVRETALRLLADGRLDRCDYESAAAAFDRLLAEQPNADEQLSAAWACKEAFSLVRAGRPDRAARRLERIRARFGAVAIREPVPGLKVSDYCDRLEKEIGERNATAPAFSPNALQSAKGWTFRFDSRPVEAAFRRRHSEFLPEYAPVCSGGIAYLTNGNELRTVGIDGGRELWAWRPAWPDRYNIGDSLRWLERLPPATLRPAVAGGRVLLLRPIQLEESLFSLCGLDQLSGHLVWQRVAWSDEPERIETPPVADAGLAWIVVSTLTQLGPTQAAVERRAVVCFRAGTGERLWRTALPAVAPPTNRDVLGSVAGPFLAGDSVLVLEDRGPLYSLDRVTGEIQWVRLLDTPAEAQSGRPGQGRCAIAPGRVCAVAAGGRRIDCLDAESGLSVWSVDAGSPAAWLAADAERTYVIAGIVRALSLNDGSELWKAEPAEPPAGEGCLVGDRLILPMPKALCVYETNRGKEIDRLGWPSGRPLTRLQPDRDGLVGAAGDVFCKFGMLGASPTESGAEAGGPNGLSPVDTAALLFAGAQIARTETGAATLSNVGCPQIENPKAWIVHDAEAQQLRCVLADNPSEPRWEIPVSGSVRAIEFDESHVYLWVRDRIEIRTLNDGAKVFSADSVATAKPVFGEGKVAWPHNHGAGGVDQPALSGYSVREKRRFEVALADLGLRTVQAWLWEGEFVYLLGDRPDGRRVYIAAKPQGEKLNPQHGGIPADERIRSVDFNRAVWIACNREIVVCAPETMDIYCYHFTDGQRAWKIEGIDRPIVFLQRAGNRLLYCYGEKENLDNRHVFVAGLNDGARDIEHNLPGHQAAVLDGKLAVLRGPYVNTYRMETAGSHLKELRYSAGSRGPAWLQRFGDRIVVALADEGGTVRQAEILDTELRGAKPRFPEGDRSRYADVPFYRGEIQIDGRDQEWTGSSNHQWTPVEDWYPVLDRAGQPLAGSHSRADLHAEWRACATEEALCLIVRVEDDVVAPAHLGDCPWLGDSIELAIRGETGRRELPTVTLSLNGVEQNWAAGPRLPAGASSVRFDPAERKLVYEIQFPWKWLEGLGVQPSRGVDGLWRFYFALAVNDNDGQGLEGSLAWGPGLVSRWEPESWRTLRFYVQQQ